MLTETPSLRVLWSVSLALAATAAGCGKSVSDIASSVKDAASQGVQSVKGTAQQVSQDVANKVQGVTDQAAQTLEMAGSMQLTIDQPLQVSACYASFSRLKAAGAGVLQLQSYRDAGQETFPSVFVRAPCSSATLAELTGQTLAAQMFVQPQQNGPVWSATAQPVQLKITAVQEKEVKAEIVGGSLAHSGTGATQAVTGTFQGMLP
jgi:predicted small secreted protein